MPQHEDSAGWTFKVEEVSAGVYRVHGVDEDGQSLQATGTDPDALLEEGKRYAAQVMKGNAGMNRVHVEIVAQFAILWKRQANLTSPLSWR